MCVFIKSDFSHDFKASQLYVWHNYFIIFPSSCFTLYLSGSLPSELVFYFLEFLLLGLYEFLLLRRQVAQAHVLDFLLLFLELRAGRGLLSLLEAGQLLQCATPLLLVVHLGRDGRLKFTLKFRLSEKIGLVNNAKVQVLPARKNKTGVYTIQKKCNSNNCCLPLMLKLCLSENVGLINNAKVQVLPARKNKTGLQYKRNAILIIVVFSFCSSYACQKT